jgi:hypothetical protein
MRLRLDWKHEGEGVPIADVDIFVDNGQLIVESDEQTLVDDITDNLLKGWFVDGKGFPILEKDLAAGTYLRGPDGGPVVARWVDLNGPPNEVLEAIRDNLRFSSRYEVTELP